MLFLISSDNVVKVPTFINKHKIPMTSCVRRSKNFISVKSISNDNVQIIGNWREILTGSDLFDVEF